MVTDETNPAAGIRHDGDDVVLNFYDTDDANNTKEDPIVERSYRMHEDVFYDGFVARVDSELDLDMIVGPETLLMFIERRIVYEILDTMDDVERVE